MGLTLDRITAYSVTFCIVPGRRFTNDGGKNTTGISDDLGSVLQSVARVG